MIPASVSSGVASLDAALLELGPYLSAQRAVRLALYQQAANLAALIEAETEGVKGQLDGYAGDTLASQTAISLLALEQSAFDQTDLTDLRGTIGRMILNIALMESGTFAPVTASPVQVFG